MLLDVPVLTAGLIRIYGSFYGNCAFYVPDRSQLYNLCSMECTAEFFGVLVLRNVSAHCFNAKSYKLKLSVGLI